MHKKICSRKNSLKTKKGERKSNKEQKLIILKIAHSPGHSEMLSHCKGQNVDRLIRREAKKKAKLEAQEMVQLIK